MADIQQLSNILDASHLDPASSGSEDEAPSNGNPALGEPSKKKKKKKPKKKAKAGAAEVQTEPPRVGLSKIYIDGVYPEGEIQEYTNEFVLRFPLSPDALELTIPFRS